MRRRPAHPPRSSRTPPPPPPSAPLPTHPPTPPPPRAGRPGGPARPGGPPPRGPARGVARARPWDTGEASEGFVEGRAGWDVFPPEGEARRGAAPLGRVSAPACGPAIERQIAAG